MPRGQLAQPGQEAGRGRDHAHVARHRLHDDRRDLRAGCVSSWRRTASRSLNGTVSVSAASALGTPRLSGTPKVAPPEPAFTSRLSAWPW